MNHKIVDVQKQLVHTILDNGQKVKDLELDIENKNDLIKQLEVKLSDEKHDNTKLKSEIKTRNEQMKLKNKTLENVKNKLEMSERETESIRTNLNKKLINLERKNTTLGEDLEQKKIELKKEKNSLKKISAEKSKPNKSKTINKETQTMDMLEQKSQITQTNIKETIDSSTSPLFTKIHLEGTPTHDITCLCICHDDIQKCDLQLFKFTSDTNEAVETIYYKEDYSDYDDLIYDEIESPNEEAMERIIRLKSKIDDDDLMKEMIGEALKTMMDDNAFDVTKKAETEINDATEEKEEKDAIEKE